MDNQTLVTADEINRAYTALTNARADLRVAKTQAIDLETALRLVKAKKILAGEIAGKNADEREANAREALPEMFDQAERADAESRVMESGFDICRYDVERIQALLRLMEIWSKTND